MNLALPAFSLVTLVGCSGSGKSTFAQRHFRATEVVSHDACRAMVTDDPLDPSATAEALDLLHTIVRKRLAARRLTVVDATHLRPEDRLPLASLAREFHASAVAVVLDIDLRVCVARCSHRPGGAVDGRAIGRQRGWLRSHLGHLEREGFRHVHVLHTPSDVEEATVERTPLGCDRSGEPGPFDIIGDVHGCCDELEELLARLGYARPDDAPCSAHVHPQGRRAVFVGDLVDRGPRILDTCRLVRAMVEAGTALAVPGNHDDKLVRKLRGHDVRITHGLERTLAELEALPEPRRAREARDLEAFLGGLASHVVLDGGRLVVAHAGLRADLQWRASPRVRQFCLYGETSGDVDAFGLPVRCDWAARYRGSAMVVYGHTPVPTAEWLNHTVNVDTGCVFGGALTALRYPEKERVSVPARRAWYAPVRPLVALEGRGEHDGVAPGTALPQVDDVLDLQDFVGRNLVETRLLGGIPVRAENAAAALEVLSRFSVHPRWLIYLPPTMPPAEASALPSTLEHPTEVFAQYRKEGIDHLVCQEKHVGTRAVVVVCRNEAAAWRAFGLEGQGAGIVYTRTGRRFFADSALEEALLERVRAACEQSGLFATLGSDWVCLDCELMPGTARSGMLPHDGHASVGSAAMHATQAAVTALERMGTRGGGAGEALREHCTARLDMARRHVEAWERHGRPADALDDLRLAPFHVMASEGAVHSQEEHGWHLAMAESLCSHDRRLLQSTRHRPVDLADAASVASAIAWWEELTESGGGGLVIKPSTVVTKGRRGLAQPAMKVRSGECLRLVCGPEYSAPENLERLRTRKLGVKRILALKEFALGIEGLERFVRREPLRRVHECTFAVLALESEPVDPLL